MTANTDYVLGWLGGISGSVGWDINAMQLVVDDAVELYGVSTEAEATDTSKLNPLLRYATARRILREASMDFDYSADGESYHRSQVSKQVAEYLVQDALVDALPYLDNGTNEIESLDMGWSPYRRSRI
jgi:hypothetical protein